MRAMTARKTPGLWTLLPVSRILSPSSFPPVNTRSKRSEQDGSAVPSSGGPPPGGCLAGRPCALSRRADAHIHQIGPGTSQSRTPEQLEKLLGTSEAELLQRLGREIAPLDQIAPTLWFVSSNGRFLPCHGRDDAEESVSEPIAVMWTRRRGSDEMKAVVFSARNGLELRVLLNDKVQSSELFMGEENEQLLTAVKAKQRELDRQGWRAVE